jgi:hypothetical protein
MNQPEFDAALQKLQGAITDPAGDLRPITRIDFEVLDGGQVRWTIWQDQRRLYTASGHATDVTGFLAASRMILEMRAQQTAPDGKGGAA